MWAQAGFRPDDFWHQTPRHFQVVMQGVRKRLEREAEASTAQAYETGAFGGLAQHGKLKSLSHYLPKKSEQSPEQMLAMLKTMGSNSDMRVRRVKIAND